MVEVSFGCKIIDKRIGDSDLNINGNLSGQVTFGKDGSAGPTFTGSASVGGVVGPFKGYVGFKSNLEQDATEKYPVGLKLGVVSITSVPGDAMNDIKFSVGMCSVGFAGKEWTLPTDGTASYKQVSGVGPVLTALNGTKIPEAVELAELGRDVRNSVVPNKQTMGAFRVLDSSNMTVEQKKDAIANSLASAMVPGVNALRDDVSPTELSNNEFVREATKIAAQRVLAEGAYPDGILRSSAGYEATDLPAGGRAGSEGGDSRREGGSNHDNSSHSSGSTHSGGGPDSGKAGSGGGRSNGGALADSRMEGTGNPSGDTRHDSHGRSTSDPQFQGPQPVVLDLNGNGIDIDDVLTSTRFIQSGDDGLQHRTAWAAAGDGVLFIDADRDGKISDTREYVFTEWSPGAADDTGGRARWRCSAAPRPMGLPC